MRAGVSRRLPCDTWRLLRVRCPLPHCTSRFHPLASLGWRGKPILQREGKSFFEPTDSSSSDAPLCWLIASCLLSSQTFGKVVLGELLGRIVISWPAVDFAPWTRASTLQLLCELFQENLCLPICHVMLVVHVEGLFVRVSEGLSRNVVKPPDPILDLMAIHRVQNFLLVSSFVTCHEALLSVVVCGHSFAKYIISYPVKMSRVLRE